MRIKFSLSFAVDFDREGEDPPEERVSVASTTALETERADPEPYVETTVRKRHTPRVGFGS